MKDRDSDIADLYSQEAERGVLGALALDMNKLVDISDLKPADFFSGRNQAIFAALSHLYSEGKTTFDTTLIIEYFKKDLAEIGGLSYLSDICKCMPTTSFIKEHARIVKEYALKRKIYYAALKAKEDIKSKSVEEVGVDLETAVLDATRERVKEDGSLDNALVSLVNNVEKRKNMGGEIAGIKTHLHKLDKAINGLNESEFIILAARPSMGKTTVSLQIALNVVLRENKHVSFFSIEMAKEQVLNKCISNIGVIEMHKLKTGGMYEDDFLKMMKAANELTRSKLRIYECLTDINEIKLECKKLKMQNKLDVVIIDYLGLLTGVKAENRNMEITRISAALKQLAKELKVNVICLSQLSRTTEVRADKRPILSDLRDSGSIEQDADIVLFLYRDEYYRPDTSDKGVIEVIIAKNRNGEVGKLKLAWNPAYNKVYNISSYQG